MEALEVAKKLDLEHVEKLFCLEYQGQKEENEELMSKLKENMGEEFEKYKKFFKKNDFPDNSFILHDLYGLTESEN